MRVRGKGKNWTFDDINRVFASRAEARSYAERMGIRQVSILHTKQRVDSAIDNDILFDIDANGDWHEINPLE